MPRACILTYGCQMNVHDSEIVAGQLARLGYEMTPDPAAADAIFVNTCTVREHAKLRGLARIASLSTFKRRRPGVFLAAMGCVASEERGRLFERFPFLDAVIPTDQVTEVARYVSDAAADFGGHISADTPRLRFSGFKAYVTIITGCNMDCTYCIVPKTRGRERSRPMADVLREVAALVAQGYREIVFLGQTVNAYGDDLPDPAENFTALLRETDRLFPNGRVRFLSPHPQQITDGLISAWPGLSSLCGHIHLPVQSGSDRILRRMKRLYTRDEFLRKIDALRRNVPDIVITTDLIVGFPGETEEDFQETLSLCESVRFDSAYMYIYSPRQNTAATRLKDPVPSREAALDRHGRLVELQTRHTHDSFDRQVGRTVEVLIESAAKEGGLLGKSRATHDVVIDAEPGPAGAAPAPRIGDVVRIEVESVVGKTLRGRVVAEVAAGA
ncbi:MAG: tRNA (N6-isopentenyl adenosine(37)-C2)-methylthiotransferase MiaB [Candidatus Lindowbacteria bacterium RIFCSPLOWO2_12_FULL_62_27]|nr:MAG: tRNA (N6-isopentenyl adenosine(37)-C2)-methylthiotransferase MiaB [Candidatus Lindowbacteria bacterium RIFCSPLOWO2_12_FULL_62_27]OGH63439.1 MAG: tRNA (N6-isopentenyl adenosine(37)-C2)-methylthiotransferase MiaB [Candidatus Lindowbacteria bacterium RIFCSPLOWO2_02_FULL_62_12]